MHSRNLDANLHEPLGTIALKREPSIKLGEFKIAIEILSYKSLYIEMYFNDTLLSSATAALIANDKDSHCALITARHNLTGRHQYTGMCLHSQAAIPNTVVISFHPGDDTESEHVRIKLPLYRDTGEPFWIEHPILKANADIAVLNLNWANDVARYPYYLQSELDSVNLAIGPAESLSVIGFPFGRSRNGQFPIWATGFLAQELSHITEETPSFLIDCRTRQGQSGSPVVAFRPSGYRVEEAGKVTQVVSPNKAWEFLGIYSGRINDESDLGTVWHRDAIKDLLDAAAQDYESRSQQGA